MKHNTQYFSDFMARYNYSEESVKVFTEILAKLDEDEKFGAEFDKLVNRYMSIFCGDSRKYYERAAKLGEPYGFHEYSMHFVFLLCCVPLLEKKYEKKGIDKQIFWDTMDDLRCKLNECIDCKGIPGTFVVGWFRGFFEMTRFTYGRFQFEKGCFGDKHSYTLSCGKVLKPGGKYVNIHIPSSGVPLTDEVRFDSYRRAWEAFKFMFDDDIVIFGCGSWLLFQPPKAYLPPHLNTVKFMNDFEIVSQHEGKLEDNAWRIFGKYGWGPAEQLPRDTTLRKAFAEYYCDGNPAGSAFGVFAFDGEKILK